MENLCVSRGVILGSIEKLAQRIVAEESTTETKEISLKALEIVKEAFMQISGDARHEFDLLATTVLKTLENSSGCSMNLLEGGGKL